MTAATKWPTVKENPMEIRNSHYRAGIERDAGRSCSANGACNDVHAVMSRRSCLPGRQASFFRL